MILATQKNLEQKKPLTLVIGMPESSKTHNSILILKELFLEHNQEQKNVVKGHK